MAENEIHAIPCDDIKRHAETRFCWCAPREDAVEPDFWLHNAADGREAFEEGKRRSN